MGDAVIDIFCSLNFINPKSEPNKGKRVISCLKKIQKRVLKSESGGTKNVYLVFFLEKIMAQRASTQTPSP